MALNMTSEEQAALYSGATMGDLIVSALARYPERIAFVDDKRQYTYRETAAAISQAIAEFDELGLKSGDTVAQLSSNRAEVFFLMAAVYVAGLRSVTLHAMGSLVDHAYITADAEAKLFVVDPAYAERAQALREALGETLSWQSHGKLDGFTDFWQNAAKHEPRPLTSDTAPEDIIRLAYTGGTTGKPKGVMLSNRALVTNTTLALAGKDWADEIRFLCPTPISHGAGSMILPTLWRGGTFILQRGFDCDRLLDAIEQHHITTLFLVPTMIYALLDHPRTRKTDFTCLHSLMYGAAPMSPARIREALEVFGPVLIQGYGQTESPNTILTLSRADHLSESVQRLGSAGKPYPGIRVRLLDSENCVVPQGEIGEICVRGPLVMSGYWKKPELTADAFRGGWLHTGDLAWSDDDGFFYIVDRVKDMIISGGFNVYPKEIENVLTAHPSVAAAAVIGVPDTRWGEAVKAVIVLRENAKAAPEELIALVREKKGPVYAPKSVDFADTLPLTALGKPDKKALRARYWDNADRNVN